MIPLGPISIPDLRSLLQMMQQEIAVNFNCHQIGTIVSFNSSLQTATVQLNVLRVITDPTITPPMLVTKSYPLLVDCPVFIASGGSGALTFPIAKGDTCLVLFNDRDIDVWWSTGNIAEPNTSRTHDLSDGLVLIGFRSKANALADYDTTHARLGFAGGALRVGDKVALDGNASTLKTVLTDIIAALTALDAKTGPSAAAAIAVAAASKTALMQ